MRTLTTALVLAAALAGTTSPALATSTAAQDRTSVQVVTSDARSVLLRPDGSDVRRLRAEGSVPAVSPDGTRIAYRKGARLVIKDLRGGNVETFRGGGFRPNSWSPNGRVLAMSNGRRIATFDLATGRRRTVLVGRRYAEPRLPAFSPDGKHIAFTQGDSFDTGLHVMRRDGRQKRTVVDSSGDFYGVISGFDWSPDGGSFVLSVFDPLVEAPEGLAVVGSDGTGYTWLKQWIGDGGGAAFSPDGTRIAYADDDWNLQIMDRDGSDDRLVARRVREVRDWYADPLR